MEQEIQLSSDELVMLRNNKQSGYNYRYRRHQQWTENYELYRDNVIVNRLIQRQSVNLPLMKKTIRTIIKYVDDMPVLSFENLDNDKEAELFKNEYWKWTVELNRMDLQDIVDKRQVALFGRSFDQWQIMDGAVKMTVEDPMDFLVARFMDPFNLHSSRFLTHLHIFEPLSAMALNPMYDKTSIKNLQTYYASQQGIVKAAANQEMLIQKNQKMADMGVIDVNSPILGETYVETALHFVFRDHEQKPDGSYYDPQFFLFIEAEDMEILAKEPLEAVIGVTSDHYFRTHFPYNSWADDLERQDFWSDGIADMVRTPNKVINSWFSQMVENRTLRNFGMNYYNSSLEGFVPQTFTPTPGGWFPVPVGVNGKISDAFTNVQIQDLTDNIAEIQFVGGMVDETTGAAPILQGSPLPGRVPLGEVQFIAQQSQQRIMAMSKFYTPAWIERGTLFMKLVEAGGDKLDAVKLYKKGKNTNDLYARTVGPSDWQTQSGYRVKVWSQDEKNTQDVAKLNKLNSVKNAMPDNPKLNEIYDRKLLEYADLRPEEINEVMQFEQQKQQAMQMQAQMAAQQTGGMPGNPGAAQPSPYGNPGKPSVPAIPGPQPYETTPGQQPAASPNVKQLVLPNYAGGAR